MDVGKRIKTLRLEKGMTLEELGNKVGVGKSTIRKWETGMIKNMRRDKIDKLAKALGVSPAVLMGWEDEKGNKIIYVANPHSNPEGARKVIEHNKIKEDYYQNNNIMIEVDKINVNNSYDRAIKFYQKFMDADPKIQKIISQLLEAEDEN